jgi:phosphoribosylaminoimidazole-succinocarboxamide synthase
LPTFHRLWYNTDAGRTHALVAESVYAYALGAYARKGLGVQVPPSAPWLAIISQLAWPIWATWFFCPLLQSPRQSPIIPRMDEAILTTSLPYPLFLRGKVRDSYDLGEHLLIISTDRLSAFDAVMANGIPGRGKVLNQMSAFWFDFTREIIPNHLVSISLLDFPATLLAPPYREQVAGRAMLVDKAQRINLECVARGYLAGSGWLEYQRSGTVCGLPLPDGLVESARLDAPIFTPSTKAEVGHDENISFAAAAALVGEELAERLRDISLELYTAAAAYALDRGIIIADTKFEFGLRHGQLILIDEALTPDSSRFWDEASYQPGGPQPSLDKQYVRDWLTQSGWNKQPPGPILPAEVVRITQEKYQQAYYRLIGQRIEL